MTKKNKTILSGFQIDDKLLEAVDKLAKETDRSRSAIIRLAVRDYVDARTVVRALHPKPKPAPDPGKPSQG